MSLATRRLSLYRSTYVAALHEYLRAPSEDSLTVAYELGRAAVNQQLSVLDVAVAYQQGLNDALASATEHATWLAVTRHAEAAGAPAPRRAAAHPDRSGPEPRLPRLPRFR